MTVRMYNLSSGTKSRTRSAYLQAVSNSEYLSQKYGGTASQWEMVSATSLLGADAVDAYSKYTNASLKESSLAAQQAEIDVRSQQSVAQIFAAGEKVQAKQAGAFLKAGVKLEGSALSVMAETASNAMEAARVRQQEADYAAQVLDTQKEMAKVQAQLAPIEFMVQGIQIAGMFASAANAKGSSFQKNDAAVNTARTNAMNQGTLLGGGTYA